MHRALAPSIMNLGVFQSPLGTAPASLLAEFHVYRSSETTIPNAVTTVVPWNAISFQSGGLGLTTDVTTIPVPAEAQYFQGVFYTRRSSVGVSFFQHFIYIDGAIMVENSNHGGDYNTGGVAGWGDVSSASTVDARFLTNGSTGILGYFSGRFFG